MNVSRRWLEAFLRRPLDARDLSRRLAMLGAAVDAVEPVHAGLDEIVVGLVEEVRPHPGADRLRVCTVNDGSAERRNVVCGASNVAAGEKYPFAPLGARLPGGQRIERRKLRGELSEGMLCSARELGLGQDHEGLWQLQTDAAPGTTLVDALPVTDERLVIDVTPNRPDLLGHKGVARELSAALGAPFRLPPIPGSSGADAPQFRRVECQGTVAGVRVAIDDPGGCPRFLAAVIRGVRVGPSPDWLRWRLESVGVRSINSVVDATNYVMFELNQPMHVYDVARLRGPAVVARRARLGERLITLDDVERSLDVETTAIADDGGAIGVGGVMGGAATEVGNATTDILLECAYFDPARIRRTRRALGLATEASYRFERGVDRWGGAEVLRRCIELVLATAGGGLVEAPLDIWPTPTHPPRVFLRLARVAQVLGVELPLHAVERHLVAIGATVVAKPEEGRIAVDVPGWRPDLRAEIDLIEEVARLHGYDSFPSELRPFRVGALPDAPAELAAAHVRKGLVGCGLYEVVTLPTGSEQAEDSVRILNPLSSADAFLRRSLLPGLIRLVEANWAERIPDVRLFEIGTVFSGGPPGQLPVEATHVAGVLTGAREPAHWTGMAAQVDRWDLKGIFQRAVALAIPGGTIQVQGTEWVAQTATGCTVGHAGLLPADAPPWAHPLFGFEVLLEPAPRRPARFRSLPVTPSSERDLALLLADGQTAEHVMAILREAGGPLLESVQVASEYRGSELPAAMRSVAFRLTFRAPERTLRDAEVDDAEARLLAALNRELGIQRRGAAAHRAEE